MNDDTQARLAVNELVPQLCDGCGKPLVTKAEQNRRLDFGMAWCDACEEAAEKDECRCSYGFYHYGDPRQFVPDEEMNTPGELAAWRAACEAWERGEHVQQPPEEHGPWVDQETGAVTLGLRPAGNVVGVCRAVRSFGMGSTYCEQHRLPGDAWRGGRHDSHAGAD